MNQQELDQLRYPTGKLVIPDTFSSDDKARYISKFRELPGKLRQATYSLTEAQLDTPYREGGWSTRQIVHHLADSHMNSFTRFKLGMTEDNPTIKPYDQEKWAAGADAKLPISNSLNILDGIHGRLTHLLENMTDTDYNRTVFHPEMKKEIALKGFAAMYAWHGHHHLTQITELKKRKNW